MTRSIPIREAAMLKPHGGSRAPSGSEKLFAGPGVSQFVFIDTDVPDIDCLLFGLEPHTRTCVLNRSPDALDQIADILAQCGALEAVHIVYHGAPGGLHFASGIVSAANVTKHAAALARIGAALVPGANVLLWACDTGRGVGLHRERGRGGAGEQSDRHRYHSQPRFRDGAHHQRLLHRRPARGKRRWHQHQSELRRHDRDPDAHVRGAGEARHHHPCADIIPLSTPRVAHPVICRSTTSATKYMPIPITLVTNRPAKASGTSKRDDATSIRWPIPLLAATVSATMDPTKATVMAILSDAKK